ncbi:MAG: glycogen/starch synthase [Candidatus Azobacteroides sp.]|nr:glycogen/starch synthase [Candidatus Azobacteroides sp.]
MTKNIKVLYISQEITPYLPESEIACISRQLPQATQEKGREIRTFMPKYGCINERRNQLHEVIRLSGMNLIIDDTDHPLIIKVASIQAARMQVYFIDNDDYFPRKNPVEGNVYGDNNFLEFDNNEERCIFFIRGVLETVKKLRWTPDIIHCHGWLTSLTPLYIKKTYNDEPFFKNAKVIFSLYDKQFQDPFTPAFREKLLLPGIEKSDLNSLTGTIDYEAVTKLAIDFSDGVIQGSKNVNNTLLTYTADSNKLFLPYQNPDEYIDEYNVFYDKIME